MATSELVSGASDGIKRQRAALSRRRLRAMPIGPMNRLRPIEPRRHLLREIGLMRRVPEGLARDEQGKVSAFRRVERNVEALLRADAPERQSKAPLGMAGGGRIDRNPVGHDRQQLGLARPSRALRCGDAVQERVRTLQPEHIRRIPVERQVQGHEHRRAGRRQVFMEIDAVHVHDVDPPAAKRVLDRPPMRGVRAATHGIR